MLWAGQNRPLLAVSITPQRVHVIIRAVASAIWGPGGRGDWGAQVAFLTSTDGRQYTQELTDGIDRYKAGL